MSTESVITAVDGSGRGLQVVFERQGDRFAHRIAYIEAGLVVDLLRSIEGADSETWPPSPPLQQLSIEPRATGDVALLVGMAGRSHWSASIEADHVRQRLVFDIACRTRQTANLISSYQLDSRAVARAEASVIAIGLPASSLILTGEAQGEAACQLALSKQAFAQQTLVIRPAESADSRATARWRYWVEFA